MKKSERRNYPVVETETPLRLIGLSANELERLAVIRRVESRDLKPGQAAKLLGLSPRQIHVLRHRFQALGAAGLMHGGRGKRSNRAIKEETRNAILTLVRERYAHLGPTRAAEHLANRHGYTVTPSTLNGWMKSEGLDEWARRRNPNRSPPSTRKASRYLALFDEWVLDTETMVAQKDGPRGVNRIELVWYRGSIGFCETKGRNFGRKQIDRVLFEARRRLCAENAEHRYVYIPRAMAEPMQTGGAA